MNSLSICEITVLMQLSFLSKKPCPCTTVETTFTSQICTTELPGFALPGDMLQEQNVWIKSEIWIWTVDDTYDW